MFLKLALTTRNVFTRTIVRPLDFYTVRKVVEIITKTLTLFKYSLSVEHIQIALWSLTNLMRYETDCGTDHVSLKMCYYVSLK